MNASRHSTDSRQGGFTVVEVLLAASMFLMITAFMLPCYTWALRVARGGSLQAKYTIAARQSEMRIARYVQMGRAISVFSNSVQILTTSNTVCSVEYVDKDNNPSTLSNNVMRFVPDVSATGEQVICTWVTANPGEPMFTNLDLSPTAVRFSYHVGEGTNLSYASVFSSSPGFQGIDVRFSATPRNLQSWYQ